MGDRKVRIADGAMSLSFPDVIGSIRNERGDLHRPAAGGNSLGLLML